MISVPARCVPLFQSTLSMRRATGFHFDFHAESISIHALHEESDTADYKQTGTALRISIHALHEESDASRARYHMVGGISIHALHEESDVNIAASIPQLMTFQSTLSMRRATVVSYNMAAKLGISIHALHEESDSAAGHFCPLFETQASCLALSISNNTADTTNNMSKTSNWLSVSF